MKIRVSKTKAGRVEMTSMFEAKSFARELMQIGFTVYTRAMKSGKWSVTAYE